MAKFHALIIDDNTQNLSVLARMVSLEEGDCTKVSHPRQLETMLNDLPKVDVIFLDLELPGKDGFQIRDMLRANPHFDGVPIVAYTVHVSEIDAAYKQGFDGFLGKPLDASKFPDQLARILKGEEVWERA